MHFPFDLHISVVTIPIHLVTDFLSIYIAYLYYTHLRKKGDHVNDNKRFYVIIGAAVGALIGSRFLASLEHIQLFLHPPSLLYYYSGKTIVGGIVGGILGVEITKKIIGQKTPTGDLFTLPIIVGIVIGRIGCFLTGVSDNTVGNPSNLPWAFDQGDGIARHPTSLYEIIFLIVLFFILKKISNKNTLSHGTIFRLFIICYFTFRIFIEFIKPVEYIFIGFSAIQLISFICVCCYLYSLLHTYYTGRRQNIHV